uniref:DUF7880 domain-containing protein n=1 Tax=Kalanchoe fedtschenkoi TaxID=63787 RepID=A0A7N0VE18_KALFE
MAATQVSSRPFAAALSARSRSVTTVRCASVGPPPSQSSQRWKESRRSAVVSLLVLNCLAVDQYANAGSIFDKYVKRKKLDPLEVYVPAVILTEFQIKDLERTLDDDQVQFDACRSLLRSGPAASLRVNIRAVAQYASDSGNGKAASQDVDNCLRALEDLDNLFLRASRKEPNVSKQSMKAKIGQALIALDSLLKTVPMDVLDKGKAIADAYRTSDENTEKEMSDKELKQLESVL